MLKFDPKKDAEITRDCFACNAVVANKPLSQMSLSELVEAYTGAKVGDPIWKIYADMVINKFAHAVDEVYCEVSPRSWGRLANMTSNMSVKISVDNGKRYNVWCIRDNRWTNFTGQDSKNPKPLTYNGAEELLAMINGEEGDFEIRELVSGKAVVKSAGMNCSGPHCNEFNPYAEANQANGIYLCFSCRKR